MKNTSKRLVALLLVLLLIFSMNMILFAEKGGVGTKGAGGSTPPPVDPTTNPSIMWVSGNLAKVSDLETIMGKTYTGLVSYKPTEDYAQGTFPAVGGPGVFQVKLESQANNHLKWTNLNPTEFEVLFVFVKGGSSQADAPGKGTPAGGNLYIYNPSLETDSGLYANKFENENGVIYQGISHVVFFYRHKEVITTTTTTTQPVTSTTTTTTDPVTSTTTTTTDPVTSTTTTTTQPVTSTTTTTTQPVTSTTTTTTQPVTSTTTTTTTQPVTSTTTTTTTTQPVTSTTTTTTTTEPTTTTTTTHRHTTETTTTTTEPVTTTTTTEQVTTTTTAPVVETFEPTPAGPATTEAVEVMEEVPAGPAKLPKTGGAAPIFFYGFGAVVAGIGVMMNRKK